MFFLIFVTIWPNVSSIVLYVSFSAFRPRLDFRTVSIHSCCISTPPRKQLCVPGDEHSSVLSMQKDSGIGERVHDGKYAVPFCTEILRAILSSIFSSCREFELFFSSLSNAMKILLPAKAQRHTLISMRKSERCHASLNGAFYPAGFASSESRFACCHWSENAIRKCSLQNQE